MTHYSVVKPYVPPPTPDYGICPYSGRPRRPTFEQSRQEQVALIEAAKGTDRVVCFCTNTMIDRGTVYHCRIDEDGVARAFQRQHWWAMSYTQPEPCDDVLGLVVPQQISGFLRFRLSAGRFQEGTG